MNQKTPFIFISQSSPYAAGSSLECSYKLMSFGIDPVSLPMDATGEVDSTSWHRYLDGLQRAEEEQKLAMSFGPPVEIIPASRDCLLGRGFPYRQFPGNNALNDIIHRNRSGYEMLNRSRRRDMLVTIAEYYQTRIGGRFLRKGDGDRWIQVTHEEGISKVGNTMRHPIDAAMVGGSSKYVGNNGIEILVPSREDILPNAQTSSGGI